MHREVDDHSDIRHARRERADAGNGDREDVLVLDPPFYQLDRRIEAFDMADHQRDAGAPGGGDDRARFGDIRGDRFLDHEIDAAADAFKREVMMQMRRRGDGDGIDAAAQQCVHVAEGGASDGAGDQIPLLAVRVGYADELHARHFR